MNLYIYKYVHHTMNVFIIQWMQWLLGPIHMLFAPNDVLATKER